MKKYYLMSIDKLSKYPVKNLLLKFGKLYNPMINLGDYYENINNTLMATFYEMFVDLCVKNNCKECIDERIILKLADYYESNNNIPTMMKYYGMVRGLGSIGGWWCGWYSFAFVAYVSYVYLL